MMVIKKGKQKQEHYNAKKEKKRKARQAITLPPLKPLNIPDLFETPKLQQLDINNLINALPPLPKPQEKTKRGRKPKPQEEITENMTYKEKRQIYMRNYMQTYKKKN